MSPNATPSTSIPNFSAGALVLASSATAQTLQIQGQQAIVLQPEHPTGKLVVYIHGAGAEASWIEQEPTSELMALLFKSGFTVAASDAHGNAWGDPASLNDYVRLIDSIPHKQIYVLAVSMGGLNAVQLLSKFDVTAWAAISPVCNANRVARVLHPQVLEAGGGSVPKTVTPVSPTNAEGLPVLIWASAENTIVPKAANADVCSERLRKAGARVREVAVRGNHGDPSSWRPNWIRNFFIRSHRVFPETFASPN